eukprot:1448276-Pleurochrysis_carterae.AAC.1
MHTRGALAFRFTSSWNHACDGRRRLMSALLEPPFRRTPAPATALALSPNDFYFAFNLRLRLPGW